MPAPHLPKNTKNRENQAGNAIVIILVMIALIAALSAVAMRSSNRTSSNMSAEKARILAERLVRTSNIYRMAVQNLMFTSGCGENEVSFGNDITNMDYSSSLTPSDGHCKVFGKLGAGLTYEDPPVEAFDTSFSSSTYFGEWVFNGQYCVWGLGTGDSPGCSEENLELSIVLPAINRDVCIQINNLLGVENPSGNPPEEKFLAVAISLAYKGVFSTNVRSDLGDEVNSTPMLGKGSFCFYYPNGAIYTFMSVLHTR